ncbi:MAG TPA: CCA tRNA nucleotidyltransferase [bacterium]|nr:CCA tRNA nucleotidyltransferase [bacterium]
MSAPAGRVPDDAPALRDGAVGIVRRLREAGFSSYWVGGCVRDIEMGRIPHDYDIVTDARPEQVTALFPAALQVGAQFGVVIVPLDGRRYEVSTFRAEGPYLDGRRPSHVEFVDAESDVRRRDFTINGLLHDPLDGRTLDVVGGRADIAARRVRTIGDPEQRFAEDRLRMLRAVRLAAELEFEIESETFRAIRASAPAIVAVSAERTRDELVRLLVSGGRGQGLRRLQESGLLAAVLPEVEAMVGVEQPPEFHPEGDVFVHTVLALERLRDPHPVLALATLLHDVGKPPTQTRTDRIRFNGHDEVGAALAEEICRRLRLSAPEIGRVTALVRDHLRVKDLPRMRSAKAKRFLLRDDAADHLELHRADCLASHGQLDVYEWAVASRDALLAAHPRTVPLLTGDDLIALGYEPGPRFKVMLDAVWDAQLEGTIRTPAEARAFVRERFPLRQG